MNTHREYDGGGWRINSYCARMTSIRSLASSAKYVPQPVACSAIGRFTDCQDNCLFFILIEWSSQIIYGSLIIRIHTLTISHRSTHSTVSNRNLNVNVLYIAVSQGKFSAVSKKTATKWNSSTFCGTVPQFLELLPKKWNTCWKRVTVPEIVEPFHKKWNCSTVSVFLDTGKFSGLAIDGKMLGVACRYMVGAMLRYY